MSDLVKLPIFVARYPDLCSEGSLRWQIFNRAENGLEDSGAIVKARNGRWLIDPAKYRGWLVGVAA